jgi:hypothetical protein
MQVGCSAESVSMLQVSFAHDKPSFGLSSHLEVPSASVRRERRRA